jgi:hypothetical protein
MLPRRLFLCACALAGLAGGAALLHQALPYRVPEVTQKLDYLKAHEADIDTVFIGSSRIYHGVSPRTFDATMSAAGQPTRSFNLAVNALLPPESIWMARTLAAMRPPHLRRVFLEMADARDIPDADHPTIRDVYWQDPAALAYALRRARLDFGASLSKSWDDISRETSLFAVNELNIGWLIPSHRFDIIPGRREPVLGPDGDGFLPILHPLLDAGRAKLAEGIGILRQRVPDRPADPLNEYEYARIQRLLQRRGVELILVMTPVSDRDYNSWQDAPSRARLLAFDNPDRYPEFYEPAHRFDSDHLNAEGAEIFSRELAQAYLARK